MRRNCPQGALRCPALASPRAARRPTGNDSNNGSSWGGAKGFQFVDYRGWGIQPNQRQPALVPAWEGRHLDLRGCRLLDYESDAPGAFG